MPVPPEVAARVDALMARLTDDEKNRLTLGNTMFSFGAIERLGYPPRPILDGPQGVRHRRATGFPCTLAMAATWNAALVREIGEAMGRETRAAGGVALFGPGLNVMRTPLGGRTFEYMGEDPCLAAELAVAYIEGVQSAGVAACAKHFVGNDQERWRHAINVVVDERALREIYLPAFEAAVRRADVWLVMNAYSRLNGPYCSANKWLQRTLLRDEWSFDGTVISDWGAVKNAYDGVDAGCDLEMGSAHRRDLPALVASGDVTPAQRDGLARRNLTFLLRTWAADPAARAEGPVDTPEHHALARRAAADACVLMKNDDAFLPLDKARLRRVAVVGPAADFRHHDGAFEFGGGSGSVNVDHEVTPLDGLRAALEPLGVEVVHAAGCDFAEAVGPVVPAANLQAPDGAPGLRAEVFDGVDLAGAPRETRVDPAVDFVWSHETELDKPADRQNFSVRWTGAVVADVDGEHIFAIHARHGVRAWLGGEEVVSSWANQGARIHFFRRDLKAGEAVALRIEHFQPEGHGRLHLHWRRPDRGATLDAAVAAARGADAVVVFAGITHLYDTEDVGWHPDFPREDKPGLALPGPQAELINAVGAANPRTAVVLVGGSPVETASWRGAAKALLNAWYPGMEGGHAVADVLFGDAEPGGRLPVTYGEKATDWLSHRLGVESYPGTGAHGDRRYLDGIWVGYRWFDRAKIAPAFCFGHGLAYTTFEYAGLAVAARGDGGADVRVTVRNTGSRAGVEVAQVYVGLEAARLPCPARALKAFAKVRLAPGEAADLAWTLDRRALSYYDAERGGWRDDAGRVVVAVGRSVGDLRAAAALDRVG